MRTSYQSVVHLTQADAIGAVGQALENVRIHIIDGSGNPTGTIMESGVVGSIPTQGSGSGGGSVAVNWTASTPLDAGKIILATAAVGGFTIGEQIYSATSITTGATFNTSEAARFLSAPEDATILKTTPGAVGTTNLADDAVTNLKLANMATKTYKGRTSAATGDPEDVAIATLKSDLLLVKADVGLGNVDNTTDALKPISTAAQAALNLKMAQHQQGHPFHTAATQAGHIVTATSQFNSSDYAGWKALQETPTATSEWATLGAASASLTYQLPQPTVFNRMVAMGRLNGTEYPTTWSLEASNDGADFTNVLIASHVESLQTEKTVDFVNTVAYKYYRFSYTVGSTGNIGLSRLRFFHNGINYLPSLPAGTTVNNTLTSVSTTEALSAAQGKALKDTADTLATTVGGKALAVHTHAQADVTNLVTTLAAKEVLTNKVTAISGASTDTQYPSAKLLFDQLALKPPLVHTHSTVEISGLGAEFAQKQDVLTNDELNALAQIVTTPTRSIPAFTANTTAGGAGNYVASAISEFSASYAAWRALRATQGTSADEWVANGVTVNIWLAILFPTARVITSARVAGRALGAEVPGINWRIEGSNDGTSWTTLYTSATAMTGVIETVSFINATAYTRYRMFAPTGSGSNPGMSFFELRHDAMGFAAAPTV